MALYLGDKKLKLSLGNMAYNFIVGSLPVPQFENTPLLSRDSMLLKDKSGVYLTVKEANS